DICPGDVRPANGYAGGAAARAAVWIRRGRGAGRRGTVPAVRLGLPPAAVVCHTGRPVPAGAGRGAAPLPGPPPALAGDRGRRDDAAAGRDPGPIAARRGPGVAALRLAAVRRGAGAAGLWRAATAPSAVLWRVGVLRGWRAVAY